MQFQVQTYSLCGGWDNIWTEDGKPVIFESIVEATAALRDHFEGCRVAGMEYNKDDYRIVPVSSAPADTNPGTSPPEASQGPGDFDPNGLDPHQPGAKLDAGKPDMSLLLDLGRALHAVAEVMTFGANKYSRGGWQEVEGGINRYTAAGLRHIFKEHREDNDPDSDLLHASHHACNALFRLELMLRDRENA